MRPNTHRPRLLPPSAPILDESFDASAVLEEVAAQIGQAPWIDPDTGALAEESRVRIEEH